LFLPQDLRIADERFLPQPARDEYELGAVQSLHGPGDVYEGRDRKTNKSQADRNTRVDLLLGCAPIPLVLLSSLFSLPREVRSAILVAVAIPGIR
jgi:hypothetical protein